MTSGEKPSEKRSASAYRNAAKRFLFTYSLVASPQFGRLLFRGRYSRLLQVLNRVNTQIALFPAAVPILFRLFRDILIPLAELRVGLLKRTRVSCSQAAAVLSSPFLLLLPHGLRLYVAMYASTTVIASFLRWPPAGTDPQQRLTWRNRLPPIWILNIVGNAIMLPLWLLGQDRTVPQGYNSAIVNASRCYIGDHTRNTLKALLSNTLFPLALPPSQYVYQICKDLHPAEPNCVKHYFNAMRIESKRLLQWVAAFTALATIMKRKGKVLSDPFDTLRDHLEMTVRSTLFITGSINTAWAAICLFQRLLPSGRFTKSRFYANGALGSFWILILPPGRRAEISLYTMRMTLLSVWNAWKLGGGASVKYGEVVLFAAGWVGLVGLQSAGYRVGGMTERALDLASKE